MPGLAEISSELPQFASRHFSVNELAALWGLSRHTITELFSAEPGVVAIGNERSTGRRRKYETLRIPEDVARRVHARLQRT